MTRIWGSAGHYIQGPNVLRDVKKYADIHGPKAFYLTDSFLYPTVEPIVSAGYDDPENFSIAVFDGEISRRNIQAFLQNANRDGIDAVVGIGGGKVIDVAKVVAMTLGSALIICPTTASTDAPASAMSILYSDTGEMNEIMIHRRNPDLVLADTRMILSAPLRFFISGLGDALSTCYEGLSNEKTGHANYVWCDREMGFPPSRGGRWPRPAWRPFMRREKRPWPRPGPGYRRHSSRTWWRPTSSSAASALKTWVALSPTLLETPSPLSPKGRKRCTASG